MMSCRKSAMPSSRELGRATRRGRTRAGFLLNRGHWRQGGGHHLLALFNLGEEALAIEVAVVVEVHVEQHPGRVLDLDGRAVQRLGELLAVELLGALGDR